MAKITPNAKQQECIDNINGKIMVLAGLEPVKHLLLSKE